MSNENWDRCENCSAQNFLNVDICTNCGVDLFPQREKREQERQEHERLGVKWQADYDAAEPERHRQKEKQNMASNEWEERDHQRKLERMEQEEKIRLAGTRRTRNNILLVIVPILLLVGGTMWGCPQYRVYDQSMTGQANLRQQEFEKLIRIEDARAQMESSSLFAQAEVKRAHGVAEANQIIGESLQNNEAYLRYLWIQGLHDSDKDNIIYVPTEANLPILEASRFQQQQE